MGTRAVTSWKYEEKERGKKLEERGDMKYETYIQVAVLLPLVRTEKKMNIMNNYQQM